MDAIKVIVKNSFSYISRDFNLLPRYIQNRFVKQLSYRKKNQKYGYVEVPLFIRNPTQTINQDTYYKMPSGLLRRFYNLAQNEGVRLAFLDQRGAKLTPLKIERFFNRLSKVAPKIENREYQIKALEKCLQVRRGLVEHPTASGKTLTISGICFCLNTKTIVLCTGKTHLLQLQKDLELLVGGHISIYGSGYKDSSGQVVISNIQALDSLKKKNHEKFISMMSKFKCVIGDEVHHAASISYRELFYYAVNAQYRFGFSGTMHREDGTFMEVEAAVGPIIDQKDYSYMEEGGYIVGANFYVIDPMSNAIPKHMDCWPECMHIGIIEDARRNDKIVNICQIYKRHKKQVLVISPFRIEHGAMLEGLIPESKYLYGKSTLMERKQVLRDFENKCFHVLISSKIFDEAVNIPDVRAVVIAGGGKAHNAFFQRVGRGIRKAINKDHLDVFFFWDSHSKVLLKHSRKLMEYVKKIDTWKDRIKFVG